MPRPTATGMSDDSHFKLPLFPPGSSGPAGIIVSYIHAGGCVGALVELRCETDFIARTDEFHALGREIAMQVAAMNPRTVGSQDTSGQAGDTLYNQEYIRDPGKTIRDLIKGTITKVGENIWVARFARLEVGTSNRDLPGGEDGQP